MNKTVQELKVELEPTEGNLQMKNLWTWTGILEASFTIRIQEIKDVISGTYDRIEEIGTSVKNVKSIRKEGERWKDGRKSWHTKQPVKAKSQNLRLIGVEEGWEKPRSKAQNFFQQTMEANYKDVPIKVQKAYRKPKRLDQKKKAPWLHNN